MVQGPETKEVVFVRCLGDTVRIVVPGDYSAGRDDMLGTQMKKGEIWVVRWEGVKEAWNNGDIEVL